MNAILRMVTVLREEDFVALLANVALNPPRVVVNNSGVQVNISGIATPRDRGALRVLQDCVCPHTMERWVRTCEVVGLPARVLAQRWFSWQRYFY